MNELQVLLKSQNLSLYFTSGVSEYTYINQKAVLASFACSAKYFLSRDASALVFLLYQTKKVSSNEKSADSLAMRRCIECH